MEKKIKMSETPKEHKIIGNHVCCINHCCECHNMTIDEYVKYVLQEQAKIDKNLFLLFLDKLDHLILSGNGWGHEKWISAEHYEEIKKEFLKVK
jgi:hypothetical protein